MAIPKYIKDLVSSAVQDRVLTPKELHVIHRAAVAKGI